MNPLRALFVGLVALATLSCSQHGKIEITRARAMSTAPGATIGAAYMKILSRDGDVLLGADSSVASRVEMHVTEQRDGMMQMRPRSEVEIPAGEQFEFAPGGAHFMLMDLRAPLVAGASFSMILHFRHAGDVKTTVSILAPGEAR